MNAPLFRVRYVRVCERKIETVDQATLDYLCRASHMGIRVTSHRAATPREITLYTVAQNVAAGSADTSALTGQALKDALYVLDFEPGSTWRTGGFRPNREAELVAAGVLVPTDQPGTFTVGRVAPRSDEPAALVEFDQRTLCVNPNHDHVERYDGEGNDLPAARQMTCAHCGIPAHYNLFRETYEHDGEAPPCFLTPDDHDHTTACVIPQ